MTGELEAFSLENRKLKFLTSEIVCLAVEQMATFLKSFAFWAALERSGQLTSTDTVGSSV